MAQQNKKLHFNIDDGDIFFSDEVAVIHNPLKMFLDFKNTTPRIDQRFADHQPMVLKHQVIVMDPITAKELLKVLTDNIGQYESKFGPIEKTSAHKKAEEIAKEMQANATIVKPEKPNYFG